MANSTRREFSKRFRQALNEAGHKETQLQELGGLFEVSGQAVRKWLNGEAIPSSSRAPDIALKLGVRRAWALQMEVRETDGHYAEHTTAPNFSISADEFRLLNNYRKLPLNLQKTVDALLNGIHKEFKADSSDTQ